MQLLFQSLCSVIFINFYLTMHKAKIKYYEPTIEQLQTEKMDQIFEMLKKEEEGISSLLKKYQQYDETEDLNQVFSQKLKLNHNNQIKQKQQLSTRKSRSLHKSRSKSNILPEITYLTKQNQRLAILLERKKKKISQTIQPAKTQLRKQLEDVYFVKKKQKQLKQKVQRQKTSQKNKYQEKTKIISQASPVVDVSYKKIFSINHKQKVISETSPNLNFAGQQPSLRQSSIPQLLSPKSNIIMVSSHKGVASEPSDSEEEDIPLAYYQREFKSKITAQCIEQINYLYFSKNESIKDWSESLLTMFERHDKEIMNLRKKMRYLQRFDDKFFSIDIYKND